MQQSFDSILNEPQIQYTQWTSAETDDLGGMLQTFIEFNRGQVDPNTYEFHNRNYLIVNLYYRTGNADTNQATWGKSPYVSGFITTPSNPDSRSIGELTLGKTPVSSSDYVGTYPTLQQYFQTIGINISNSLSGFSQNYCHSEQAWLFDLLRNHNTPVSETPDPLPDSVLIAFASSRAPCSTCRKTLDSFFQNFQRRNLLYNAIFRTVNPQPFKLNFLFYYVQQEQEFFERPWDIQDDSIPLMLTTDLIIFTQTFKNKEAEEKQKEKRKEQDLRLAKRKKPLLLKSDLDKSVKPHK